MMYAVYSRFFSESSGTHDTVLFVTENKQLAEDTVALAELEQEQARSIQRPQWKDSKLYIGPKGHIVDDYANEITEYNAKIASILTIDPNGIDSDYSYHFEEVEVR